MQGQQGSLTVHAIREEHTVNSEGRKGKILKCDFNTIFKPQGQAKHGKASGTNR